MEIQTERRNFLKTSAALGIASIAGFSFFKFNDEDPEEQKVSPPEDLMQEHGVLNRILLIYDFSKKQLAAKKELRMESLFDAAGIIRSFVEDYHEKQEEDYLFPRFQKAHRLTDLVDTLKKQHLAGRVITDELLKLCQTKKPTKTENKKIIQLLTDFNFMYRPHEAREDTVLFPAFRRIVSRNEYDSLGEEFEKNEEKRFGRGGFEGIVEKVSVIEKQLGIYELAQFTPK